MDDNSRDDLSSTSSQEDNEDGWEDMQSDKGDDSEFVSLFDEQKFSTASEMLKYCKDTYNFDIWSIKKTNDLDFVELIKLVNYVRAQVKSGNTQPDVTDKSKFLDDQYMRPVLEDDALLYSLDDVFDDSNLHVKNEVEELKEQLETLKAQFQAYREDVQTLLEKNLKDVDIDPGSSKNVEGNDTEQQKIDRRYDEDYFKSYSYNTIHEIMLKDVIRTDSYRDFIYDNKHIFKDKTVLDVGCGTGILSMFCAKAGAKMVIAVDNSDIIDKAKEIARKNKLQDRITFIRGKIEEVQLPVDRVDIIVSEWMGYCLLYESMLDSVLHARDKYLAPDGLMVPSHTTIRMAPLADSDLRASHIDFWKDVYGFDMVSMVERAHEEALIRVVDSKEIAGESVLVLELDLHTITVKDLNFRAPFTLEWGGNSRLLEGFVLWFDTFFFESRSSSNSKPTIESAKARGVVAFSTGPNSTPTHWQQGILLIKDPKQELSAGEKIHGEVAFNKNSHQERSLDIDVTWSTEKSKAKNVQLWFLD